MSLPVRVSAGVPAGGQFASRPVARANIALAPEPPAPPQADAVRIDREVYRAAARLAGDTTGTIRAGLRRLLPHLADAGFTMRADMIAQAARASELFETDPDAAYSLTAPGADPQNLLGAVDADDYYEDDEDGCGGYDFDRMNADLAEEWGRRWRANVADVVAADARAAGPR